MENKQFIPKHKQQLKEACSTGSETVPCKDPIKFWDNHPFLCSPCNVEREELHPASYSIQAGNPT